MAMKVKLARKGSTKVGGKQRVNLQSWHVPCGAAGNQNRGERQNEGDREQKPGASISSAPGLEINDKTLGKVKRRNPGEKKGAKVATGRERKVRASEPRVKLTFKRREKKWYYGAIREGGGQKKTGKKDNLPLLGG